MSRVLTGDKLVESIRNRAMIPDDTSVYTDENLLAIANEEMDVQLLDKLLSLHEEHLTTSATITRTADGVYEIPYRAVGNKIRDIAMVRGGNLYELTQISIGDLSDYIDNGDNYTSGLDKFYIENNQIKLVNPAKSYDSVRIYYHLRPNYLTKVEKAGVITDIVETTTDVTYTFSALPAAFTISLVYDIVGHRTPNKIKEIGLTASAVNSTTKSITFTKSDITSTIVLGDYICQEEESPVPNIPTEMHPVLSQLAAVHVLEALGDTEGLTNAQRRLEKLQKSVMNLIDDRVELSQKKIRPRNGALADGRFGSNKRRGR